MTTLQSIKSVVDKDTLVFFLKNKGWVRETTFETPPNNPNAEWYNLKKGEYLVSENGDFYWTAEQAYKYEVRQISLRPTVQFTEEELLENDVKASDHDSKINPSHYKSGSKEVYQMMIDIWGKEAYMKHCEMTAFKYRMRVGLKEGQSLETEIGKAKWYEDMAANIRKELSV